MCKPLSIVWVCVAYIVSILIISIKLLFDYSIGIKTYLCHVKSFCEQFGTKLSFQQLKTGKTLSLFIIIANSSITLHLSSGLRTCHICYTAKNIPVPASLLQSNSVVIIKLVSQSVFLAFSGLMMANLLQVVNRHDAR